MKLLKIADNVGYFLRSDESTVLLDAIKKEDILWLVDRTLEDDDVEFDEYDEDAIKNQAHQIIYKNLYAKLTDLRSRKSEFEDEAERLFLEDFERYTEMMQRETTGDE